MAKEPNEIAADVTIAWLEALSSTSATNPNIAAKTIEYLQNSDNITDFYNKVLATIKP